MELSGEDDYEVIKKEEKEVCADEEPLSAILEELFRKHQASSTNVNLMDGYHNRQVVPSKNT